jgi:hypothetical protein
VRPRSLKEHGVITGYKKLRYHRKCQRSEPMVGVHDASNLKTLLKVS